MAEAVVIDYIQNGVLLIMDGQFVGVTLDLPNIKELFPVGKTLPLTFFHWIPNQYGLS